MSTSFFSLSRTLQRGIASACVTLASVAALGFSAPAVAEVKVGVSDWPGWVAWYVAEQKGFFKKHGADVKLVWFANLHGLHLRPVVRSARCQLPDLVRHPGPFGQGPTAQGCAGQ
jgi:hypothetical protein